MNIRIQLLEVHMYQKGYTIIIRIIILIYGMLQEQKNIEVQQNFLLKNQIITSKKSFLDLQFYLDTILDNINYKISIILVGNKKDLYNNIEIKESVGNNFAKVIKAKFAEVSAKNNDNEWNEFFENALKDYIKQIEKTIEINYDYSDNEGYNIDDYLDIFEKI